MRVCGTSDFHGRLPPAIGPCDLLLIAGDLCPHGRPVGSPRDVAFQREWLLTIFLPWVDRQPCRGWFITAGNHDFVFQDRAAVDALPHGIADHLLLDRTAAVTIDGERIHVHGSPWSLRFHNWAFMADELRMAILLDAVPHGIDILMVHGPPWGIADRTADRVDAGSRSLLHTIATKRPRLSLHGHIHEASGQGRVFDDERGTTIVRNVSYLNERYEPANPPAFELS